MNYYLLLGLLLVWTSIAHAATFVIPANSDIIGKVRYSYSEVGETLAEVGRRYGIGHNAMQIANPHVLPNQLLATSTRLLIPEQFILPAVAKKGIIINLAEYRLYYFPSDENIVITFPVGIGRQGWETPLGTTQVVSKQSNPNWRPTSKVRAEAEKNGFPLPEFFPAGPYNPLGKRVLRLGWPTFLIHGTNRPDGIGEQISAGCIRMQEEDIEYLFSKVKIGIPVRVINDPIKIGSDRGNLYMQMYPSIDKQSLNQVLKKQLQVNQLSNSKLSQDIKTELKNPTGLVRTLSQTIA